MTVEVRDGVVASEAGEFTAGCHGISHRHEKDRLLAPWVMLLLPREVEVLNGRFGLNNGEPEPVAVLGERLGISGSRVRRLRHDAVAKLKRHRARNGRFKDEAS